MYVPDFTSTDATQQLTILNTYELANKVNFTVEFDKSGTDKEIIEFFELEKNLTHIMFKRNVNKEFTTELIQNAYEIYEREFFEFTIQITNE